MPSPQYSVLFSAPVSGTGSSSGSVADVMIPDAATGLYVKATAANRGTRRSTGIALSAYAAGGVTDLQQFGQVDVATAGLGAGTASWVRCSATGTLERAAVAGADDVVGWVEADGTFRAFFGLLTAAIVNGSGGGGTVPTGTGYPHITAGAQDAASVGLTWTGDATGTGTGTSFALTIATLAVTKLATGAANTVLCGGGASNAFRTIVNADVSAAAAIAASKVVQATGTGVVTVTAGVLDAASTGTTGSASYVRATSPVITTPAISDPAIANTRINNAATGTINDCTISGTAGFFRRAYFTNAAGATVTGFDATGVADGTLLFVTAIGAVGVSIQSEAAGSIAANRVTTNSNFTEVVTTGCFTILQYDLTNTRWRAIAASAI